MRLAVITAVAILVAAPAAANITRGCSAGLYIRGAGPEPVVDIARLDGRGNCGSKAKANDCRRRAHSYLATCASEMWATRWDHALPNSCKNMTSGRGGVSLDWLVGDGRVDRRDSVKDRIEWEVCCGARAIQGTATFSVEMGIQGDKGCGPLKWGAKAYGDQRTLTGSYEVDCPALRLAGICR